MAQPDPYVPATNFTVYAAAHTAAPYAPALLDIELDGISESISDILTNLVLIQRDDGALKNAIVTLDSLSSNVLTFMSGSTSAWTLKGAWLTATAYVKYDVVVQSNNTYVCCTAHTSGTFATDLAAVKWLLIATFDVADLAVTTGKIANLAVTTAKIDNLAVTAAKIAAGTITQTQMADNSIGQAQMRDGSIGLAEIAAQTLGNVLVFTTAGAPALASPGTTRQVLQVSATGTAPSFAGHGGDWGIVLGISDITTTSAISTSVTNYPSYLMMFKGLVVDTDNVSIVVTLSKDSAATYESANYRYFVYENSSASATPSAAASDSASNIPIIRNLGNAVAETAEIFLFLHNSDGNGSRYVNLSGWVVFRNTSTVIKGGNFIAGLDVGNDITNIKVAVSSGNMTAGRVIIYGIGEGI